MKKFNLLTALIILLSGSLLAQTSLKKNDLIGKHQIQLESDIMTPEILWSFGRLGDVQVSPDGEKILYGVSYYSKDQNSSNRELFVMNIDGSDNKQITHTAFGEYNAVWRPDGQRIGFMCAAGGDMQIWEMDINGENREQISYIKGSLGGFKYSPDQNKILFIQDVKLDETIADMYPDLPKSSGRVNHDLMYRHWDTWVDSYTHIFVSDYVLGRVSPGIDIMLNEKWESPMKPFGGMEQITWSPDSKSIVYTCRKKQGKEYSLSTNSDLYQYFIDTKQTKNLTNGMMGYDTNPTFSPDGSLLAWESMERDGYESDKSRLFTMNMETGEKTYHTLDFDQMAHGLSWAQDGKSIYFISDWHATDEIYKLKLKNNKIEKITEGVHNYRSVVEVGKQLIATRVSMSKPSEIYAVNPKTGEDTELSFENKHLLDQLTFGKVTKRWVETTDQKQMLVWVILPPHFDESKSYPGLLYCQGGPQGTVSQFWSYRWNFQMMAANDYVIVAPNRRGLPGFGQEWLEQISGDYGGQNMKDYLSAIDAVKDEKWLDENRLGAIGASYGGFSVYWLAGHHNKRFKAFIAHDGMFNLEAQYLETEEMWFANWDLGGPFWDKDNEIAQRSFANSPHKFVQNWDTPIMIIHSELDYRIVASQGMSAYNAAVLLNVPAEYLYFPDENHWVLKPQNGILWQRRFYNWLDKWLK
ncbi:MAG: peptidase S9 [Bacteroidetes bacterium 4572_77]|nr:MAG: peptidase S9 [Bacteroidetes bacterium 4572_77]